MGPIQRFNRLTDTIRAAVIQKDPADAGFFSFPDRFRAAERYYAASSNDHSRAASDSVTWRQPLVIAP
jgi:hypothetical protein